MCWKVFTHQNLMLTGRLVKYFFSVLVFLRHIEEKSLYIEHDQWQASEQRPENIFVQT